MVGQDKQYYVMFESLAGEVPEDDLRQMEEAFRVRPRRIIEKLYRIDLPQGLAEDGTTAQRELWVQTVRDRLTGDGSFRVVGIKGELGTVIPEGGPS